MKKQTKATTSTALTKVSKERRPALKAVRRKKTTAVVIDEQSEIEQSRKLAEEEQPFPPFTTAAWNWLDSESIPGAEKPILYLGPKVVVEIAQALGQALSLKEVQRLVQTDGPKQKCAMTEKVFQPVAYVYNCTESLAQQLEVGTSLLEATLPLGGQFFEQQKGEPLPISGAVFYRTSDDLYRQAGESPLIMMGEAARRKSGHFRWGIPLHRFEEKIAIRNQRRQQNQQLRNQAAKLADLLAQNGKQSRRGQGFARVGDAFDKPSKLHRRERPEKRHRLSEE